MLTKPGTGLVSRSLQGAAGGLAATAVMSIGLGIADELGVMNHQPPMKIVKHFLPVLDKNETEAAASTAHVGYGVSAGMVYGALVRPAWRNAFTGVGYGLLIWFISYEGWLPAFGILPPAHRDKPGRAGTMLGAHILYGASLGIVSGRIARRSQHRRHPHRHAGSHPADQYGHTSDAQPGGNPA
ncbi:MAG TPA: DUF6789 family protein [Micrococcaceae bacterium]|jgi:hypothetical protein|nr:DUF6789 family protein [Micrococcaceae bacterium]